MRVAKNTRRRPAGLPVSAWSRRRWARLGYRTPHRGSGGVWYVPGMLEGQRGYQKTRLDARNAMVQTASRSDSFSIFHERKTPQNRPFLAVFSPLFTVSAIISEFQIQSLFFLRNWVCLIIDYEMYAVPCPK